MDRKQFVDEQEKMFEDLGKAAGGEVAGAFRSFYSLYGTNMVDWFAGLFDSEIGGYYYSNSARDNATTVYKEKEYDLLPDAESTSQALGFITNSGLARDFGGSYAKAIPAWMGERIADYVYNLQDPDGYFYHPQWGKEIGLSRRSRDFNWSIRMLKDFGRTPKYATILDKKDDSKKDDKSETLIPEHLSSKEKFLEYLEAGNIAENSYSLGNQLSCQGAQIKACGLEDVAVDFLNSNQHADTGHWHKETNYLAVNGVMKITGFYVNMGKPIPNALRTAESAIYAITSDQPVGAVVDLWNTWESVVRIIANLQKFGGDEGAKDAKKIISMIRENAMPTLQKSLVKISDFKRDDGGFSYKNNGKSFLSQGMPVSICDTLEGDVNATVISSALLLGSIYASFGLSEYKVPMFGECDRQRYVEIIENNRK